MLTRWLLAVLSVTALVAVGSSLYWFSELSHLDYQLDPKRAALAVGGAAALTSSYLFLRWFRWHFFLRRFTHSVRAIDSFQLYFATLPALLTPFNVGELIRVVFLRKRDPSTTRYLLFVWVLERLVDLPIAVALLVLDRPWQVIACLVVFVLVARTPQLLLRSRRDDEKLLSGFLPVTFGLTVAIWTLPVLALKFVMLQLGTSISIPVSGAAVGSSILTIVSGLPLGAGIAASVMIVELCDAGVAESTAILGTALFRYGTAWFAVALGLVMALIWRKVLVGMMRASQEVDHFDSISHEYQELIPPHVRERLLLRKVNVMLEFLQEHGIGPNARGLDIGCGQGMYARELAARGYRMSGIEQSAGQLEQARKAATQDGLVLDLTEGSALSLPYQDESFDFAYLINVIHHVPGQEARDRALQEVLRVLRRGGVLFLHEINTSNPLFRFYMGYVFPFIRRIDDGTEEWILPSRLPRVDGQRWLDRIVFFTFLPEFVPQRLIKVFGSLERMLEQSRFRIYSAHFMASLVKGAATSVERLNRV